MARGLNKVQLIGNLGADPETRALPSGVTVTNLRVATSEQWKDKQSGEAKERVEWHAVTMFGKIGEIAAEYLKKGSKVFLEGSLRTRKWEDKQGNGRSTTEINATEMLMLDGKQQAEDEAPPARRQRGTPARSAAPADYPVDPDFDDKIPM